MLSGKHIRIGIGSLLILLLLYFLIDSNLDVDSSEYLKRQIVELRKKLTISDDSLKNKNEDLKLKVKELNVQVKKLEQFVSHENVSNNLISPEIYEFSIREGYVVFPKNSFETRVWIDVPNSFPWRKCLHEWSENAITYGCDISESLSIIKAKAQNLELDSHYA